MPPDASVVAATGPWSHLSDYNFTTSTTDLKAEEPTIYSIGNNDPMEVFDYPGLYLNQSDGTAMAKLRMQEEEAVHKIAHGASVCRAFTRMRDPPPQSRPVNWRFLLQRLR